MKREHPAVCTDELHTRIQATRETFATHTIALGRQELGDGRHALLANCQGCGSTLAWMDDAEVGDTAEQCIFCGKVAAEWCCSRRRRFVALTGRRGVL
jgi:hypothetical protein